MLVNDHFVQIYTNQAEAYHQMIAAEDVDGNILGILNTIADIKGKRWLDLGSGTGRLPLLLHRQAGKMIALDLHAAMLAQNRQQRDATKADWWLLQADMGAIPLPAGWAEITSAGWSIGHLRSWYRHDWRFYIGRVLNEMLRLTAKGGWLFILETLGTGRLQPAPPVRALGEYYQWLEGAWGFKRYEIQTDYQFPDVETAVVCTEFFFGEELAQAIRAQGWARLPEWTGVWVRRAA